MDELIVKIENIVKVCAKQIIDVKQETIEIENKEGIGNIVTQYDKKIQEELKSSLLNLLPEANFIGEENDYGEILKTGYTFIVDPIDGTTNFSRNLSLSAISVALLKDAEPYIGVCYNPYIDEMFIAQKGKGAYLNGKSIKVSNKKLQEGILLTGNAPYYADMREKSLKIIKKIAMIASDFRRFGSAVIELCNIACGRAELYIELKLQPWDYAAGMLIVKEAGGNVSQMNGEKITFDKAISILASNNAEDYLKYL